MPQAGPSAGREQLEAAIAAQESLRGTLDDAIIDATIATLRAKLSELEPTPQQRKQVSVLFMDVVGSTNMILDLDPEENLAIMDTALQKLSKPVEAHGGHVSRYMGDGFKAVFGAPVARENDPEMAIRAGLGILAAAKEYAGEIEATWGIQGFTVRVGINTGLAVIGGYSEAEDTIMGPVVNLAGRLEGAAEPGTILIAHDTYKHVRGVFDFEALAPMEAKGFSEPVNAYRVLGEKVRPFYRGMRGVEGVETRMVGREVEFQQLQVYLQEVIAGEGQMLTVVGEAGLGKSRLLYEFENWVDLQPGVVNLYKGRARLETQSLPYGLLRDLFAFRFGIQDDDGAEAVKEKLVNGFGEVFEGEEEGKEKAHIIGQLLGYGFQESPYVKRIMQNPQQLRDRALLYIIEYFKTLCMRSPVLVLLEDLHWADEASLDALNYLVGELKEQAVFLLATARHGLLERRPNWGEGQDYHRRVLLKPLSKRESRKLVADVLQRVQDVPEALSELVVNNAEGNPFYVEELIKMLVEDEVIVRHEPYWQVETNRLEEVHVPSTLTGVLQARLDGLPADERRALQGASVVGRVFWDQVLEHINASAGNGISKREIAYVLEDLRARELIFHRETSAFAEAREHIFKHALLREVTYESVLKRVRQAYHALVAEWLIEHAGKRAGEVTGLIAEHLEQAGKSSEALAYLQKAGEEAAARYANEEAVRFYERALKLLMEEPDTIERDQRELAIQMGLGPPLIAMRGFGAHAVERTYSRARELAIETNQSDTLFQATWGQWVHYNQIGDSGATRQLIDQLFDLAEQSGDESLLLEAHHAGWTTDWPLGNAISTVEHVEKALEIYNPKVHHAHFQLYGHDPKACGSSLYAANLWFLGYPDQAIQRAKESVTFGRTLEHPFSTAFSMWGLQAVYHLRGEHGVEATNYTQEFRDFVEERGFPLFIATGLFFQGASLLGERKGAEGLAKIREAEAILKRIRAEVFMSWVLDSILEGCLVTGAVEEGLHAIEREKNLHPLTGERFMESEIRRHHGELMLAQDPNRVMEAEKEFRIAIEIAERQSTKSLELRAVMSLARLWHRQGKIHDACERLSEIYNWFTEGFDTEDLKAAKALLEELGG